MLNEIKEKLNEFAECNGYDDISYGRVTKTPGVWNYVVFGREKITRSGSSDNDFNRRYRVALVHEDYIPEGHEVTLIQKLSELKGLKLAKDDLTYDYAVNPKNGNVVEMVIVTFIEPMKGYKVRTHDGL